MQFAQLGVRKDNMRVPVKLSEAFGKPFEELITQFATELELMEKPEDIHSVRFLARSVVPHIEKLSSLFNRAEKDQSSGLDPYWKESSNPENLRLAYFLYFMPSNLYRIASVWAELHRLGYQWPKDRQLRGIELGAGPAAGACGIAAGEKYAPAGLPPEGNWALIEQDRAMLDLGAKWARKYFENVGVGDWGTRTFHRKIELKGSLLPSAAPKFNLWVMSFFLNEFSEGGIDKVAGMLFESWERHLDEGGIVIISEPALKLQSRRLLELRKVLLDMREKKGAEWLKVLTPCLGHQGCGALAAPEDWCHEEVSWWRPPYFRVIDKMAGLDRKSLPFSYLVLTRDARPIEEILPGLAGTGAEERQRLVSPAHKEGQDQEFFLCGQDGKRRARFRARDKEDPTAALERGDILVGAEVRGDMRSARVEKIKKLV